MTESKGLFIYLVIVTLLSKKKTKRFVVTTQILDPSPEAQRGSFLFNKMQRSR